MRRAILALALVGTTALGTAPNAAAQSCPALALDCSHSGGTDWYQQLQQQQRQQDIENRLQRLEQQQRQRELTDSLTAPSAPSQRCILC